MSLYHFYNKKNKVKNNAENIYFQIICISKEYIKEINHPINQDFKTTFEIFSLFLIMYFKSFPTIVYDSIGDGYFKDVTNLLRRVAVRAKIKTNTMFVQGAP